MDKLSERITIAQIAEMLKVTPHIARHWAKSDPDFPRQLRYPARPKMYLRQEVVTFFDTRRIEHGISD